MRLVGVSAFFVLFASLCVHAETVLTVDPSGGGDATTIGEAVAKAPDGARIIVKHGAYRETVTIDRSLQFDAEPPTYKDDQLESAAILLMNTEKSAMTITSGAGRVQNFVFMFDPETRYGDQEEALRITGGRFEVAHNTFHYIARRAIVVSGGAPNIHHNGIWMLIGTGIQLEENGGGLIEDNHVKVEMGEKELYGSVGKVDTAIRLLARSEASVRRNLIDGAPATGIGTYLEYAGRVEDNEIVGATEVGIMVDGDGRTQVRNNHIHDTNGGAGIRIQNDGRARIENNRIVNAGWVRKKREAVSIFMSNADFVGNVIQGGEGLPLLAYDPDDHNGDVRNNQVGFKDCDECPEMVVVKGHRFLMGDYNYKKRSPRHRVDLDDHIYAVGRFEVTFEEWEACFNARQCHEQTDDEGYGRGRHPVVNIDWAGAQEYLRWLSEKTGKTYRLLTEAEWEFAALGGRAEWPRDYPTGKASEPAPRYSWGRDFRTNMAICKDCGTEWDGKQAAPVGRFAPNGYGIYDMHGNVFEWVEDCFFDSYDTGPYDAKARTAKGCEKHTIRGGAYASEGLGGISAEMRNGYATWHRSIGIRVARTMN